VLSSALQNKSVMWAPAMHFGFKKLHSSMATADSSVVRFLQQEAKPQPMRNFHSPKALRNHQGSDACLRNASAYETSRFF